MSGVRPECSDGALAIEIGAIGEHGHTAGCTSGIADHDEEAESSRTAMSDGSVLTSTSFSVSCGNRAGACSTSFATRRLSVDEMFSSIGFIRDVEWTRNLLKWFVGGYNSTHRYCAYVFGSGGEGKTRVVRELVRGMKVFECRLTEPYAFDGFASDTDILLVEDVNWSCFHTTLRSTLLSITARQPAVIQRKYKPQITVLNDKVLTLFTSNFKLPSDVALRRRCFVVWAKTAACIDAVPISQDDPGDDDASYVNPRLTGAVEDRASGKPNSWVWHNP